MSYTLITDQQWDFLEPLVHEKKTARGRPPRQHRQILDGVFWMAINVTPWRELPEKFGKWNTIYRQFCRWSENGLWDNILARLEEIKESGEYRLDEESYKQLHHRLVATRAMSLRTRTAGRPVQKEAARSGREDFLMSGTTTGW